MTLPPLLMLLACVTDNGLAGKGDPFDGGDSGWGPDPVDTRGDSEAVEVCNGEDDDGDGAVDEGYSDADGDGVADCVDPTCPNLEVAVAGTVPIDESCVLHPVEDPWDVEMIWSLEAPSSESSAVETSGPPVLAFLKDDNGDGEVGAGDRGQVLAEAGGANQNCHILAIDAATGAETWDRDGMTGSGGIAIGDVDGDGLPDVATLARDEFPTLLDGDGSTKWLADYGVKHSQHGIPTIADLDGDGYAEIVMDSLIIRGDTGELLANLSPYQDAVWNRTPVVVDLDRDGRQEILLSGSAFDADGTELWAAYDGHKNGKTDFIFMAPADVDGDGVAEVLISGDGAELATVDIDGRTINRVESVREPASDNLCLGDLDGDGANEVVMPMVYGTAALTGALELLWYNEELESNPFSQGCATFDLDGDGAMEVVLGTQDGVEILDGLTGGVHWKQFDRQYGGTERVRAPIVADPDQDGHAEIYVAGGPTSFGILAAFRHAGPGWAGAGPVWPLFNYTATAYTVDGSVPSSPEPGWAVDGLFRGRPAQTEAPDLQVVITDYCTADCSTGPVEVAVQVSNHGGRDVPAGTVLTLTTNEDTPRVLATTTLPAIAAGESLDGTRFEIALDEVIPAGVRATIDPDGLVEECHDEDNSDTWSDVDCF